MERTAVASPHTQGNIYLVNDYKIITDYGVEWCVGGGEIPDYTLKRIGAFNGSPHILGIDTV